MELTTQTCATAGMPIEEKSSDQELLARYRRCRDEAAFEILVRRYGPLVLGVCRRVIGRHHDAEEAFQGTFLVLAQKAMAGRIPEALPNWLYGVAYRTALKRRSVLARRRAKEVQVAMFPEPEAPANDRWADIAPVLDRELSQLPGKYQAAVICCDIKGMSRETAARALGWPEGTLKVRLMRGRSILAKRLARQGVVLSAGALAVVISQNAASAAIPSALVASTVHGAGALLATQAVSTTAVGTKAVTVAKTSAKAPEAVALRQSDAGDVVRWCHGRGPHGDSRSFRVGRTEGGSSGSRTALALKNRAGVARKRPGIEPDHDRLQDPRRRTRSRWTKPSNASI